MAVSALQAAASIASLNLCTDEYLLLLAKPQEIASVSFLSKDPQESELWKLAKSHPMLLGITVVGRIDVGERIAEVAGLFVQSGDRVLNRLRVEPLALMYVGQPR